MSLTSNFNATATITRKTRTGTDDGTPIYAEASHTVAGWFDELDARSFDEPTRDLSIAFMDRRAAFYCDAGSDIQQDDVLTMDIGGVDRGSWEVSVLRTAPIPGGVGHLEVQLQGVKESV